MYTQWNISQKRKEIEPVVGRWMNLESVIQSEVRKKKKTKYCALMHIYGIKKDGIDECTFKAGIVTHA